MERLELTSELGREILAQAKAKGASHGDVVMVESDSFFVTVRMGEVEKISQAGEKRLRAAALLRQQLGDRVDFRHFTRSRLKNWSTIPRAWPKSRRKIRIVDCRKRLRLRVIGPNWICSTTARERFP